MLASTAYPASAANRAIEPANARLSEVRYRRALVVANPIAGRGRGRRAAGELLAGLRSAGVPAELYLTQGRRDGWRYLRSAGAGLDLVVSVGGDGTLSEVLAGLVDPEIPVAQLPLGDVDGALEVILAGHTTPLDSAEVNGRLSFLCTGSGIDGLAVAEVERRRKGPIRKRNYLPAMWRALRRYRPPQLRLSVDGSQIPGTFGFVLISNVREYGAFFHLSSKGRRDDGRIEAYGLRQASLWGLTKLSLLASLKELPGQMVELYQGQHFQVEAPAEQPYQVDGDLGGLGSFEYRLSDRRFRILVPAPA
jgi:diacylglycerol kinase (ATP)